MALHLIADSGLQFYSTIVEFNPQEPLLMESGKALKYAMCIQKDILTQEISGFDVATYNPQTDAWYPVGQVTDTTFAQSCQLQPDGTLFYDETGVPKLLPTAPMGLFSAYSNDSQDLIRINSLTSYRCVVDNQRVPAFDVLLGKWLPMPMFRLNENGVSQGAPFAWCRVKIEDIGDGSRQGARQYRLTWAFDTRTGDDLLAIPQLLPLFYDGETEIRYSLCNVAQQILAFLSVDAEGFNSFSGYVSSLFGLGDRLADFTYITYYIYLVNFLRLLPGAAPEVTLFKNDAETDRPVDMVLDIGNSRTCGVLFENGNFDRARMLALRDMTHPHLVYKKSFDMRFCFRMADVGLDISLEDDRIFSYGSFVRVGDEARHLLFTSLEDAGIAQKLTNYSSPKRYLWDEKPYSGVWENLITRNDTSNVQKLSPHINVAGLSYLFADDGRYVAGTDEFVMPGSPAHYSRSSLMTFVMIEIFQQALMQMNAYETREHWGDFNIKRYLRNVIITCPTAMSKKEQMRLRQAAKDALDAIGHLMPLHPVHIIPETKKLAVSDQTAPVTDRTWIYDEATACQLVYLYAEATHRYEGRLEKLFEKKGHVRPEMAADGYTDNSLTIGTIDIGAGTTDVMVCTYRKATDGQKRLSPEPLFYDSFTLAGDDILQAIIQNFVIQGAYHNDAHIGSINSALTARLLAMPEEELRHIPSLSRFESYRAKVEEILVMNADSVELKNQKKRELAADMTNGFFGADIAAMDYKARRCRLDFNTQISHPMSQFFMEQMRLKRPNRVFSFNDIFPKEKPASYLLDYFESHFGFRFESLAWHFDPEAINTIICSVMEGLMKQLSVLLHAYHCDIIVLGGRPTSLDVITELFVKYVPVTPDRLVRLNSYHVGHWYPFADANGFFFDQKPIVAVGAMVGYMASTVGFKGMALDLSLLIKNMSSTARYVGIYDSSQQRVEDARLTPDNATASFDISIFPCNLGCRQLDSPQYQARPLYAIYNHSGRTPLRVMVSRSFQDDRELLTLEEATYEGETIAKNKVELVPQSLPDDASYWLDKGEFKLQISN
ncbi:MAG: virulence factor SrfB [Bacteroidales bacterium]|nr:virulence factor SrfB [Bacteroidales bacterium]